MLLRTLIHVFYTLSCPPVRPSHLLDVFGCQLQDNDSFQNDRLAEVKDYRAVWEARDVAASWEGEVGAGSDIRWKGPS